MSHTQRLGHLGIGVEATAGAPVVPTHWLQLSDDPSIKDMVEYENIENALGRVESYQGQKAMRKFGEGEAQIHLDETIAPLFFGLILGSLNSATAGGALYDHTITINNTNNAKTASLYFDRIVDKIKFAYAVLSELTLSVSEDFAMLDLTFNSKKSASASETPSYVEETHLAYHEMTAQFGDSVAEAELAEATPLKELELTISREASNIFESGSDEPRAIPQLNLEIEGSYSLVFENEIQKQKYLNNTKKVMIVKFTNGNNFIKIVLPNLRLKEWEPDNALSDIVVETAEFNAHYDFTTSESIRAVVRNLVSSYSNF